MLHVVLSLGDKSPAGLGGSDAGPGVSVHSETEKKG